MILEILSSRREVFRTKGEISLKAHSVVLFKISSPFRKMAWPKGPDHYSKDMWI